jgi:hypothetical protein
VLALGADISQRLRWPTAEDDDVTDMAMSAIDVVFNYMQNQTFLQGFSNVANILSATAGEDMAESIARMTQTLIGSQVVGSSLLASIERVIDPQMESIIPDRNEPLGWRTAQAGIKRLTDRLPIEDDGTAPLLRNRFYTPRLSKNATVLGVILPPFMADILGDDETAIRDDPVMMEIVRLGIPVTNPSKKMEGVALTAEENERLLEFSNLPPEDDAISFYSALKDVIGHKGYEDLTIEEQQTQIMLEDSSYKRDAKEYMLEDPRFAEEFADLRERVAKKRELRLIYGRQSQ